MESAVTEHQETMEKVHEDMLLSKHHRARTEFGIARGAHFTVYITDYMLWCPFYTHKEYYEMAQKIHNMIDILEQLTWINRSNVTEL